MLLPISAVVLLAGCATYEEIDRKNAANLLEMQAVQKEAELECHDEVNALYGNKDQDMKVEPEACERAQRAAKATAAAEAEQYAEPRPVYGVPGAESVVSPSPQPDAGPPASAYYVPNAPVITPLLPPPAYRSLLVPTSPWGSF